jgi:hypothetical protein
MLLGGCGGGLALVPVSGVVTLDGKPVADAGVLFAPVAGGPPATGGTDANGAFELRTNNRPGAVVGKHRVTVIKRETLGLGPLGPTSPKGIQVIWHVPERYSKAETSGLQLTVERGGGEFPLALSSK